MNKLNIKFRKLPIGIEWFNFRQYVSWSITTVLDNNSIDKVAIFIESAVINILTVLWGLILLPLMITLFIYRCVYSLYKYIQYSFYLLSDEEEKRITSHIRKVHYG